MHLSFLIIHVNGAPYQTNLCSISYYAAMETGSTSLETLLLLENYIEYSVETRKWLLELMFQRLDRINNQQGQPTNLQDRLVPRTSPVIGKPKGMITIIFSTLLILTVMQLS